VEAFEDVRDMIEPPYPLDLNPTELAFSKSEKWSQESRGCSNLLHREHCWKTVHTVDTNMISTA
jgi:hypothetical protein